MFGRRRHRAPINPAPAAPVEEPGVRLSEEQLFEKLRVRLDQHMGSHGDWTLVRRTDADTDTFFHEMAAFSLARELTTAVVGAPAALDSPHSADDAPEPTSIVSTITVTTMPSSAKSGAADVDPAMFDAAPAGGASPERSAAEHVMFELNTVAVWADPQRHDPAHVDPAMVTPTLSRAKKRWNGTRV